ncbi:MAG: hypothetical protein J6A04_07280 [Clostridia bacterium]|nr:hypothetical protein [Clostridia bacterium]
MEERNVLKEQQQIAFRCFVKDTEKLIKALNSGYSLNELSTDCTVVCGYENCTDGYESGVCNMNRWIHLLLEAAEEELIPTSIITFLEYIYEPVNPHKTFISRLKHIGLRFLFLDFECVKSKIIEDLTDGFCLHNIIMDSESFEDAKSLHGWATFLAKAEVQNLIPGGDLLDFLNFI